MKIVNKTKFATADLRRFVVRIAQEEMDATKRKQLTIRFTPARQQSFVSGYAWGRTLCQINMPTKANYDAALRVAFCATIAHEIHHCGSGRYGRAAEIDMRRSVRYGRPKTEDERERQRQFYAWAITLPLTETATKPKSTASPDAKALAGLAKATNKLVDLGRKQRRLAKATNKLVDLGRKQRRLAKLVRKWRGKLNYYERRCAAFTAANTTPKA